MNDPNKNIRIEDYDYPLPESRIAYYPAEQRDSSKLLIYNTKNGATKFIFYFDTNTRMVNQSVFCHEGPSRGGESEKGCCIALLKQQRAMAEKMCERDFKCYVRWSAPGHNSGTERVFDTFDDVIEYLEGTSNVDFLAMISAAGVEGNAANFSAIVWRDKAVEYSISIGGKLSNIPPRCKSDMK